MYPGGTNPIKLNPIVLAKAIGTDRGTLYSGVGAISVVIAIAKSTHSK